MGASLSSTHQQRLLWQCRRGMLELDLLLQAFVENGCQQLNVADMQTFEQLLQYPDQLLLEYLLGQEQPIDKDVARIVQSIRQTTKT